MNPLLARRLLALVLPVLIAAVLLLGGFFTVDQGAQGIVTRLGAAVRVAGPGAHLKLPLVEAVHPVTTRVQAIEWAHYRGEKDDSRMESYSRDQQSAHLSVKVTYHAKSDERSVIALYSQYQSVEGYTNAVIVPRVYEAVKSTFGRYSAVEAIQQRAKLNAEIEQSLRALVAADGPVVLDGLQLQDIKFSDDYEHAIGERMKAEVEVSRVAQNLERERKSAEITVVQARAQADSELARAEAAAKAIRLRGEAEAAAIQARGAALRDNPKLVELTLAEKWNGQTPQTVLPGSAAPFVSVK